MPVELGVQRALMLLCSFALCDVDVDAYYPLRTPIFTLRNSAASLDPSASELRVALGQSPRRLLSLTYIDFHVDDTHDERLAGF